MSRSSHGGNGGLKAIIVFLSLILAALLAFVVYMKYEQDMQQKQARDAEIAALNAQLQSEAETTEAATQAERSLTQQEAQKLFSEANDLMVGWVAHKYDVKTDNGTSVEEDGVRYVKVVSAEFADEEALKAALDSCFEKDAYASFYQGYLTKDGVWYVKADDLEEMPAKAIDHADYSLEASGTDRYTFKIEVYPYGGPDAEPTVYTYTLTDRDGRWVFTGTFAGLTALCSNVQTVVPDGADGADSPDA
ncbi:MAG: hypothetical protein IJK02_06015 [Clostridia bacterium]|nr:hypothetical protein [Clostridia bacterium]MBR0537377.1 hypothetical protein [Clostridia bacterium]